MIPVYVLTGFLGSGKTTLLNALLDVRAQRQRTGRIALVVNELGAVGIDGALLPTDATRQIELAGGCVCCVLGPELDRSLHDLADAQPELDAIVLETTGVAEPLPIAWALEGTALASRFRLAAIITVVDAIGLPDMQPLSPAVDNQVRHADVLVLSKLDLATTTQAGATARVLDQLAPAAPRLTAGTAAAAAWLDDVLDDPPMRAATARPMVMAATTPGHGAGHGQAHGITSVAVDIADVLDLEELEDQLAALPPQFVRIKGLARVVDGRRGRADVHWAVFHRVGLRVSSAPIAPPMPPHARTVGLGPNITVEALAAAVLASRLSP